MKVAKIHASNYLPAFCVGVVLGVALAYFYPLRFELSFYFAVLLGLILGYFLSKNFFWRAGLFLIFGGFIAWSLASVQRLDSLFFQNLYDKQVEFSGRLYDDVAINQSGSRTYRLENIRVFERDLPGEVLVFTRQKVSAKRGDIVTVSGIMKEGVAGYQATINQAEIKEIQSQNSWALNLRNLLTKQLDDNLSPEQAGLAGALLAGRRRHLPQKLSGQLQIVGLTHLVVASGFHLTVVVRGAKRLSEKKSRKLTFFLGLMVIFIFSSVTGASVSMLRASLMASLSLLAWYYGRPTRPGRMLLLVLALVLLVEPSYLWGNVAFYLSFSAFAGVMLLGPIFRQYFWGKTKLGFWKQLFTEALVAQIATLPLTIFFFGKFSILAILANILIVPVASPTMFLSLLVATLAWLPIFGDILVAGLQILLNYIISVINYLSKIPLAQIDLQLGIWEILALYALIVLLTLCGYWRNARDKKMAENLASFNLID